jgi:hypothetical protein
VKKSYHPVNNADSMWNRSMTSKKAGVSRGGKDIQKMLGIEDDGMERASSRGRPMSLMDVLKSMYEEEEDGHS